MAVNKTGNIKAGRRSDYKSIARFLEELSWLLKSNEDLDFRAIGHISSELEMIESLSLNRRVSGRSSNRIPVRGLVGVLPSLFVDEKLFKSNKDIADFSKDVLSIEIPRWEKISRFEIIGHIVCRAEGLPPMGIDRLILALEEILSMRSATKASIEKMRNSGIGWNEIIQDMLARR